MYQKTKSNDTINLSYISQQLSKCELKSPKWKSKSPEFIKLENQSNQYENAKITP